MRTMREASMQDVKGMVQVAGKTYRIVASSNVNTRASSWTKSERRPPCDDGFHLVDRYILQHRSPTLLSRFPREPGQGSFLARLRGFDPWVNFFRL